MTIIIKAIILILFGFIFFSLGSALYYLVRGKGDTEKVVKALTWRISISVFLFILLFIAYALGWIQPHSL